MRNKHVLCIHAHTCIVEMARSSEASPRPKLHPPTVQVRLGKSQKDILNDKIMGKISDRFGGGKRETSFI